jgi:hypothetical protein
MSAPDALKQVKDGYRVVAGHALSVLFPSRKKIKELDGGIS